MRAAHTALATIALAVGVGVTAARPLPTPYSTRGIAEIAQLARLGLPEVVWDVSSADSAGADWQQIARNVTRHLRPGDIVLMHENRGQTIRALRYLILPALQRLRLRPVSLETLLAVDPPSRPLL